MAICNKNRFIWSERIYRHFVRVFRDLCARRVFYDDNNFGQIVDQWINYQLEIHQINAKKRTKPIKIEAFQHAPMAILWQILPWKYHTGWWNAAIQLIRYSSKRFLVFHSLGYGSFFSLFRFIDHFGDLWMRWMSVCLSASGILFLRALCCLFVRS